MTDDQSALASALQRFCTYMSVRNYSPFTIEHRRSTLTLFVRWLTERRIDRAEEVTPEILEAYRRRLFAHRKADGGALALRTQMARLIAVRAFFRWLAKEKLVASNPAAELELPRGEKRLPATILSEDEVDAVLSVPDTATALGLRDRAIMETLYITGMRRLELTRLRLGDVDDARRLILIRKGKGSKDRYVPTGERLLVWLAAYRRFSRPQLAGEVQTDALFVNSRGAALQPKKLTARTSAHVTAANLSKKGACHLFRHAAATHMLEHGAVIRFIQAMLGHESLDTTRIYTHVSIGPLAAVHAATHPGAVLSDDAGASPLAWQ